MLFGGHVAQIVVAREVPVAAGDPVLVRRVGDRLLLRLNRPERRNAYGREMRDALVEALRVAAYDDTVARVLIDGAGRSSARAATSTSSVPRRTR
ncbi:MAG: hypothetical protein QOD96_7113 [Pseudonocardiales bacterium]|nr:hypothetical protein [Pseudonocardiales bacterium]